MPANINGQGRPSTGPNDSFERSDLYLGVYDYVQKYMSRYDMSHDFDHVLRVLALAKHILKEERQHYGKPIREDLVILAALLHDVGDRKYIQPGENADTLIKDVLDSQGCPQALASDVVEVIRHVSYSHEIKDPSSVGLMVGKYAEFGIVQDADRLDAIGAIGIGRTFAYGAAKASDRALSGTVEHFTEKLERLEGMMKTETGRRLARERTQRLKDFRRWWEEEVALAS